MPPNVPLADALGCLVRSGRKISASSSDLSLPKRNRRVRKLNGPAQMWYVGAMNRSGLAETGAHRRGFLLLDAEKLSDREVRDRFQPPPDIDIELQIKRSVLLIGNRGSGKTMLLRKLSGIAGDAVRVYGDLRSILNPVSRETGSAGLSMGMIRPSLEGAARAMAVSLIAAWFADSCRAQGLPVDAGALQQCLPKPEPKDVAEAGSFASLWSYLATHTRVDMYRNGPEVHTLVKFVAACAAQVSDSRKLLLLLDRAEAVPYPATEAVIQLLDQSNPFIAVMAARPGILGADAAVSLDSPAFGDDYDGFHLGRSPYSGDWRDFQKNVLESWIPNCTAKIPPDELDLILRLSRDSLRFAIEICSSSFNREGLYDAELRRKHIVRMQNVLRDSAQGRLRHLNADIGGLVRLARAESKPSFCLPVQVCLEPREEQGSLFRIGRSVREMTLDERFVQLALRIGLLTTVDGVEWHPFALLEAVEVFPLYIWREGDTWCDTQPSK